MSDGVRYVPADVFEDANDGEAGVKLVVEQGFDGAARAVWHLQMWTYDARARLMLGIPAVNRPSPRQFVSQLLH
jgi:hypothetical protein